MSYLHGVAYSTAKKEKGHKELAHKAANINFRTAIVEYLAGEINFSAKSKKYKEIWEQFCNKIKELSKHQLVIITTNYDLLIEKAIKKIDKDYFYPAISTYNVSNEKGIPIFKLHGSVNWMERRFFEKLSNNKWDMVGNDCPKIFLRNVKKIYKKKNGRIYHLFIKGKNIYTPIFIPFFIQKEQWFNERWGFIFKPHWQKCEDLLKAKIEEIYFIGYNLRVEDHLILQLLIKIFGKKSPKKIEIYCKPEDKNLEKILSPFNPKVFICGLEGFLNRNS